MKRSVWIVVLASLLTAMAMAAPKGAAKAAKMSNEDCLACHNDASLTKDENGKQVSLHVDEANFKASIHSSFGCIDCHTDIKAFPHDPTPAKAGVRDLPCRPADGLRTWHPCQSEQRREIPTSPSVRTATAMFMKYYPPVIRSRRSHIPTFL